MGTIWVLPHRAAVDGVVLLLSGTYMAAVPLVMDSAGVILRAARGLGTIQFVIGADVASMIEAAAAQQVARGPQPEHGLD